jgi:hypothetical protein
MAKSRGWFRFRFRLRMLLLLPVLFAAGWWWVTWPERTARRYVEYLAVGDVEAARAMITGPQPKDDFWGILTSPPFQLDEPSLQDADWSDYLLARRRFDVRWRWVTAHGARGDFVAERGCVSLNPSLAESRYVVYPIKHGPADDVIRVIKSVFSNGVDIQVALDERNNSAIILASGARQHRVGDLILALDHAPEPVSFPPILFSAPDVKALQRTLQEFFPPTGDAL